MLFDILYYIQNLSWVVCALWVDSFMAVECVLLLSSCCFSSDKQFILVCKFITLLSSQVDTTFMYQHYQYMYFTPGIHAHHVFNWIFMITHESSCSSIFRQDVIEMCVCVCVCF